MTTKTICSALLLLLLFSVASADQANLVSKPLILEKSQDVISDELSEYLKNVGQSEIKVWVYFTDKGVFDSEQFEFEAGLIELTEQSLDRRSKVRQEQIVYADIRVNQDYIENIISYGADFKRASRWLNAASFMVNKELLDDIAGLPFVQKIRPVAKIGQPSPISIDDETIDIIEPTNKILSPDLLDYGASYGQLNMINVPVLHQMGHNGMGVVIAMFDSGFRRTHAAFDSANAEGRVLAEYDFINDDGNTQNEDGDVWNQHNHGTSTWSTAGGYLPGTQIGPAFGASFVLAKTEDIPTETPVEEDNWIAALEWADSIGTDIVSSSVSYSDWYYYSDFDGQTAPITIATNTAASLGILVCNSMGNSGPSAGTLSAPADAYDMLAIGAVASNETLASFSSRGPTYDGRIKPEVCAQGVSVYLASASDDVSYTYSSGTSFSTPLTAGAAAILLSSNPNLTPIQLRAALMETADNADTPDNDLGWGIIDLLAAYNWGANFRADTTVGEPSLTVQFNDSSHASASSWKWYFGDGDSSDVQHPVHTYLFEGTYDVTLMIESSFGTLQRTKSEFITLGPWVGLRGDANNDDLININDITFLIAYLYMGGQAPPAIEAGDADSNGLINLLDITYLIRYLYYEGPPPAE